MYLWRQPLQVALLCLGRGRCPSQFPWCICTKVKKYWRSPHDQDTLLHFLQSFSSVERKSEKGDLPVSLNVVKSSESSWRNSLGAVWSENKTTTVSLGYHQNKQWVWLSSQGRSECSLASAPTSDASTHDLNNEYFLKIYKTRDLPFSTHSHPIEWFR